MWELYALTGYKEKLHTKIIRVLIPLFVYIPVSLLSAVSFTIALTLLSSVLKAAGLSGISEADMLMWVNALSSLPVCLISAVLYINDNKKRKYRWAYDEGAARTFLPHKGLIVLSGILICVFGNYLINLFPLEEMSEGFKEVNEAINNSGILTALVSTAVVAPVCEELLMRGLLYRRLRDYTGFMTSALLSSLLFGIIHMNIVQFIYAFLAGMVFAYIYERYQSVKASIICHSVANISSFLLGILFALTGEEGPKVTAVIVISFIMLGLTMAAIYRVGEYREIVYCGCGDQKPDQT